MIKVCPNSTGWPSSTQISFTVPSAVEGTWFIVFIASTIITVSPFLIFWPSSTNFFAPGSGEWYAVPIIGTAYLAAEPGAKKFVEVGDKIKKGQTVMIVEAMKTMNHVPSTSNGEVKKILVEDGQPVEFGQTLIILK